MEVIYSQILSAIVLPGRKKKFKIQVLPNIQAISLFYPYFCFAILISNYWNSVYQESRKLYWNTIILLQIHIRILMSPKNSPTFCIYSVAIRKLERSRAIVVNQRISSWSSVFSFRPLLKAPRRNAINRILLTRRRRASLIVRDVLEKVRIFSSAACVLRYGRVWKRKRENRK